MLFIYGVHPRRFSHGKLSPFYGRRLDFRLATLGRNA